VSHHLCQNHFAKQSVTRVVTLCSKVTCVSLTIFQLVVGVSYAQQYRLASVMTGDESTESDAGMVFKSRMILPSTLSLSQTENSNELTRTK